MANILDQVKTVILVMMENRSFDHMLGHLSLENPGLEVEGLRNEDMERYSNDYNSALYPVYPLANDQPLEGDLPHEYDGVDAQMQWNKVTKAFTMHGFVEAYAKSGPMPNPQSIPMGYFPSNLVPITHFLARNFCTCDHWFSPLPTSTQPNRTMALCGESAIFNTHLQLIPIRQNLFDWMKSNGIRWKVYHDGFSFFALYNKLWPYVLGNNFRRFDTFYSDQLSAPTDADPQVIIIEPCYQDAPRLGSKQPNDNHAPLAIGFGEDFLRQIYLAVTANPKRWNNTLMVLYYDEHGGFYDHVAPPPVAYTTTGNPPHPFNSLGPRVPGILISPFVAPGSVFSKTLDHTSVLQFLAEKFTPGASFSSTVAARKQQGIHSIAEALSVPPPRPIPSVPLQPIAVQTALGQHLAKKEPGDMETSFSNAAEQLLQQKPDQTKKKYPELVAWKDLKDKKQI